MTQQLTIIENPAAITAFDSSKIDDLIEAVRKEATSLVADVSTAKGRKELKSQAYKVSQTKSRLVELANASIAKHKEIVSSVTSERTRLERELNAIRDEVRAPAVEWEEKEESRKRELSERIKTIRDQETAVYSMSSKEISEKIKDAESLYRGFDFQEFQPLADSAFEETHVSLNASLRERQRQEAEQAELKRLREAEEKRKAEEAAKAAEEARKAAELKAVQEAKERAEREAKEAAEREERRKAEEDQRIKEAEERAKREERERIEREQAAKKAAEEAEAKRKAEEERKEREIAEAKAANEKHRAEVRKKIADTIYELALIDMDSSICIVKLIEEGKIPFTKIQF